MTNRVVVIQCTFSFQYFAVNKQMFYYCCRYHSKQRSMYRNMYGIVTSVSQYISYRECVYHSGSSCSHEIYFVAPNNNKPPIKCAQVHRVMFRSLTVHQGALHPCRVRATVPGFHQADEEENRSRSSPDMGWLLTTSPPRYNSVVTAVCLVCRRRCRVVSLSSVHRRQPASPCI